MIPLIHTDDLDTDHISYNNHGRDRIQSSSVDSVIGMVDQGSIQSMSQKDIQTAPDTSPLLIEDQRGAQKISKDFYL